MPSLTAFQSNDAISTSQPGVPSHSLNGMSATAARVPCASIASDKCWDLLLQLFSELSEDSGVDGPADSVEEDCDGNGNGAAARKRLSASTRAYQAILAWFQVSLCWQLLDMSPLPDGQ